MRVFDLTFKPFFLFFLTCNSMVLQSVSSLAITKSTIIIQVREGPNATGVLIVSGTATRNCTVIGAASFKACAVYTYPPTVTPQPTVVPSPQPSPAPTITRAPVVSIGGFRRGLLDEEEESEGGEKKQGEENEGDYVLSVESISALQEGLWSSHNNNKKKQKRRLTSILERHGYKYAAYPPDADATPAAAPESGAVASYYREEIGGALSHAAEALAKPAGWALRTFLLRAGLAHPDDHYDDHDHEKDHDVTAVAAGHGDNRGEEIREEKGEGSESPNSNSATSSSSLFDSPAAAHAAVGAIVRRARARVARELALLPDRVLGASSSSSSVNGDYGYDNDNNGDGGGAASAAQRIKHSMQLSSSEEWQLATVAAEAQARRQLARQKHPPSWHDPLYEESQQQRRQLLQASTSMVPSAAPTDLQVYVQVACGNTISATNAGAESYIGNDSGDKVSFGHTISVLHAIGI